MISKLINIIDLIASNKQLEAIERVAIKKLNDLKPKEEVKTEV